MRQAMRLLERVAEIDAALGGDDDDEDEAGADRYGRVRGAGAAGNPSHAQQKTGRGAPRGRLLARRADREGDRP